MGSKALLPPLDGCLRGIKLRGLKVCGLRFWGHESSQKKEHQCVHQKMSGHCAFGFYKISTAADGGTVDDKHSLKLLKNRCIP